MPNYTERLTPPTSADKLWVSRDPPYGGYNDCLIIDKGNGFVLPNCTGYVHGRWMEIGKTTTEYNLYTGDAGGYWGNTTDGYERGSEPKLGACICFTTPGAGHVAVVERIIDSDTILCSESDYDGDVFSLRYRYRRYGWNPSTGWNTTFQGYIYHPDIEGGGPSTKPVYPVPGPKPKTEKKKALFIFKKGRR